MSKKWTAILVMLALAGLTAGTASAGISSFNSKVSLESPFPTDLQEGSLESDTQMFLIAEQMDALLLVGLSVDINAPGTYTTPDPLTGGTLSAGLSVESYLVHFDRVGNASTNTQVTGATITFDRPILGVIVTTAYHTASDSVVGNAGVTYAVLGRNLNFGSGDIVTLSADMLTITLNLKESTGVDNIRIITTPEPGTLALFGLGIVGLIGARVRRKRQRTRV